jgi:hypothetical protein
MNDCNRAHLFSVVVTLIACATAPRAEPQHPTTLSRATISDAIVGLIYTPHVRIAQFVGSELAAGRTATAESIPVGIQTPVVYVVMRRLSRSERADGAEIRIMLNNRPSRAPPAGTSYSFAPSPGRFEAPLRTIDPGAAAQIIGPIPLSSVGAVGVFPLAVLERDLLEFSTYRAYPDESGNPVYDVLSGFTAGPIR